MVVEADEGFDSPTQLTMREDETFRSSARFPPAGSASSADWTLHDA